MSDAQPSWPPNTRVRLRHDPMRIGLITDAAPTKRRERLIYQVRFPESTDRIPEDQLEEVSEERQNPLDLLAAGKMGTVDDFRRTLTHVRLTGRLADIIYSMEATNTDFYAYQFKPVVKLLQTPTNGLLIADEVGLGKTIEAGLIWTELRSRYDYKRLVVLCPAALREKWRDEMTGKMGLTPEICDAGDLMRILKNPQSHAKGFALVASVQGLRPPRGWETDEDPKLKAAQLAAFLRSMENEDPLVDLLVVDEAHHMRNPEAQTNSLGRLMRDVSEHLVLLTATPVHNQNRDLFSLLNLLDPNTFGRQEDLSEILSANEPLVAARDMVLKGASTSDELAEALEAARLHPVLAGNRQLRALIDELDEVEIDSPYERSRIAYRLETVNLLGHAITRTRKRDVKEWRVVREPIAEFVETSEIERRFYDLVSEVVQDYCQERDINDQFLLVTPQRMMASCMPAALTSWQNRRFEIPDGSEDGGGTGRREIGPLTERLIEESHSLVDRGDLVSNDTKYGRLRDILVRYFGDHPSEKVIVFSEFRATLAYLDQRLGDDGISTIVLKGGGYQTKDEIIQKFRAPEGPSVLLSSQVGGEGVDLQFSRVVINYDLPWNPMVVEQRIGRVDRLGQQSDTVLIWNLFYENTVDARIYRKLFDKLDLCRRALGDFEAILGDRITKLEVELLSGRLTPEQQEARIEQTAQALETLRQEEEKLEAEAPHLVAYGDYILQQVQAARDMHRWIDSQDIYAYVTDFLNINYPGYALKPTNPEHYEYDLGLTGELKFDLSNFVRQQGLVGQTLLTRNASSPVPCKFENRVMPGFKSRRELISQFHPLVRFISSKISETAEQLRPAVAIQVKRENFSGEVSAGNYVLGISLWSVDGLRSVEKLVFEAVDISTPEQALGPELSEALAIAAAGNGRNWLEVASKLDFGQCHEIANEQIFGEIEERFDIFVKEERAINEDRADVQILNLERHTARQRNVIATTIANLRASGKTRLIPANEGRLKSLEERNARQTREIDSRRDVKSKQTEICVAVINVS